MNLIKIFITDSSFIEIPQNFEYEFFLEKCIGYGSYGLVFSCTEYNLAVKILTDSSENFDKDFTDYHECEVVKQIIDHKENFQINCNQYAVGNIVINEAEYDYDADINIQVNKKDSDQKYPSIIRLKDKVKRFILYENYKAIVMPIFIPLYKFINDNTFIKIDIYLCKMIDLLVRSCDEFISIGLINMDIKINNAVLDENGDFRFIDFGMVRSLRKIDDNFDNESKYYIWPFANTKISHYIPYMIAIFVLEIFYSKVHNYKNTNETLIFAIDRFSLLISLSTEIKELIKKSILNLIEYQEFRNEFNKIKSKYNLDQTKLNLTMF